MTAIHITDTDSDSDSAMVLDASQAYPYYRKVDPRTLRTTGNSRVVGDIRETRPELVTSMAEHGFDPKVSVINAVPDPDGVLRVIVGFHRTAAAVAVVEKENPNLWAGVLVHEPGTRRDELVGQGIENIHRKGFTHAEEASHYRQLALEGLDDEAIARVLTQPLPRVRAGLAVAANTRTHAAVQQMPEVDLLTMAQLSEFADDEETYQDLLGVLATRPGQFDYYFRSARNRRERDLLLVAEQNRLTEQGDILIADEEEPPEGTARLEDLVQGSDATPIEPEQHASCPGRAVHVYVDYDLQIDIVHFCVDFAEHGHRLMAEVNVETAKQQLREQGVRITDSDADGGCELQRLFADTDAEHTLTQVEHQTCPGHAAYVDTPYGTDAVVHWICTDYTEHGHVLRSVAPATRTEPDAAYLAAERKRAKVNNAAWKIAKEARRAWLTTEFFSEWRKRNKLPARAHHWLGLAEVLASGYLADAAPQHSYACALLGLKQPESYQPEDNPIAVLLRKKSTTETQAIMIRFAMVIGACEQHWDLKYTENADSSWRAPSADTCFYFELVAALGHELSPVEQLINDPGADADRWPHLSPTSGLGSDDHDGDESEASESDDEPDNDVDVIDDPADNAAHDAEAQVG